MENKNITDKLSEFLASSFCLYLMIHNYHWNVAGVMFHTLHNMFQEQYTELWKALDVIAERIRALGALAPATVEEFKKLSCLGEPTKTIGATAMINSVIENTEKLIDCAKEVIEDAEKQKDQPTVDLMSERIAVHQKYVWMLKSLISKG